MVFHALTFALVLDLVNINVLKIMLDPYHSIDLNKYSSKFAKNMALYFVTISQSTHCCTSSVTLLLPGPTIIQRLTDQQL